MEFNSLDINASALTAQRVRMDTIASNLANINTTRQPDGSIGAYRRKQVVFAPILFDAMSSQGATSSNQTSNGIQINPAFNGIEFSTNGRPLLKGGISSNDTVSGQGVHVTNIVEDSDTPTRVTFNPGHPDADENGYVEMPNINVVNEMVDMISASRAYEANLTAVSNFKSMFKATLRI